MTASEVAGALAEAGVRELLFAQPAQPARLLKARETDLPGVLATAAPGTVLSTPDDSTRFVLTAAGWANESTDVMR